MKHSNVLYLEKQLSERQFAYLSATHVKQSDILII